MNGERLAVAARSRVHAALGDPARLSIVDVLVSGDASPGELAEALGMATNLVAHHLKVLERCGLVVRHRSEGDRRRTYLRLVPETLAGLAPAPIAPAPRVVFVCRHNSARTEPATRVHPRAVRVARRHGLALAHARPVHLTDVVEADDLVVAVCDSAHEGLGARHRGRLHWSVPDPAAVDTDDAFEAAYADLAGRVDRLVPTLTLERRP